MPIASPAPVLGATPALPLIIGLAGPAGCGKSTTAALLANMPGWERLAFADPLRALLLALHPAWDSWHLGPGKDLTPADGGLSARAMMRAAGDWAKGYQPDFFVAIAQQRLWGLLLRQVHVAVEDVRYEPEAAMIRACGGVIVHVSRTEVVFRRDHDSELGIEPAREDLHLRNWGGIRDLRAELNQLLPDCVARRGIASEHPHRRVGG